MKKKGRASARAIHLADWNEIERTIIAASARFLSALEPVAAVIFLTKGTTRMRACCDERMRWFLGIGSCGTIVRSYFFFGWPESFVVERVGVEVTYSLGVTRMYFTSPETVREKNTMFLMCSLIIYYI